jgi:hypothetical protein
MYIQPGKIRQPPTPSFNLPQPEIRLNSISENTPYTYDGAPETQQNRAFRSLAPRPPRFPSAPFQCIHQADSLPTTHSVSIILSNVPHNHYLP